MTGFQGTCDISRRCRRWIAKHIVSLIWSWFYVQTGFMQVCSLLHIPERVFEEDINPNTEAEWEFVPFFCVDLVLFHIDCSVGQFYS